MSINLNLFRIFFVLVGLVLHFIGHRYLSTYSFYYEVIASGFLFQIIGLILTFKFFKDGKKVNATKDNSRVVGKVFGWQLLLLVSSIMFIAAKALTEQNEIENSITQKALLVAWLAPLFLGLFWAVGIEAALRRNSNKHGKIDFFPIAFASQNWFSLGLFFSGLVALNFAALKTDQAFDLSYFKTTKPGPATVSVATNIKQEIEIIGFFSRGSEVTPFVREYLDALVKYNDLISYQIVDKDYAPDLAERFRSTINGQIIMLSDGRRQRVEVGETLEDARKILKKLDQLILADLLSISMPKETLYLVQGHGEMTWIGSGLNPKRSLANFQKMLRSFNYIPKHLSFTTGRFTEVPSDATIVAIIGPSMNFSQIEVDAIKEYVDGGGKLLILLDIEFSGSDQSNISDIQNPLESWLASIGINFKKELLANEQKHLRYTQKKLDRAFLATNDISSHESVAGLSKNDRKTGLIVLESGHLELNETNRLWKHIPTIRALDSTFVDLNRNLEKDEGEKTSNYVIAAASESQSSRIITFADATLLSDLILVNPGNQLAILDAIKWLSNLQDFATETSSEEDIKILHSKVRDLFVFHGAIYFLPMLVLLVGFLATRRRKVQ